MSAAGDDINPWFSVILNGGELVSYPGKCFYWFFLIIYLVYFLNGSEYRGIVINNFCSSFIQGMCSNYFTYEKFILLHLYVYCTFTLICYYSNMDRQAVTKLPLVHLLLIFVALLWMYISTPGHNSLRLHGDYNDAE